jgi:uncharacterized protein
MPEFTEYAPGTPCWVDLTSPELDRSIAFYSELFGWTAERDPRPEAGGYTMFSKDGSLVAAGSPPQQEGTPSSWSTYIASDDVDATAAKITEAGGSLLMDPFDVFDAGRMVFAQDPTGAAFGVWQAGEHHGAQLANEPGSFTWNECHTTDPAAAAQFYASVFGYGIDEWDMGQGEPYRVLKVGEKGVAGMSKIGPQLEGMPPAWSTVFAVADTDASVAKAQELGAELLMPPMDIPDIGRFAALRDPVGAPFEVLANPS